MAIASVVLACGIGFAAVGCGAGYAVQVSGGGSGVGISNAKSGTFDLGMASKEVTGTDAEGLVVYKLCLDGIAIVVNTENTEITNLTTAQLKGIYIGTYTTWNQVGGTSSEEIHVVHREDGSGTRDAFIEKVGIDEEAETLVEGTTLNSTNLVMSTVAGDANAIGYISLGSLDDTLKAVSIDGVEASEATVLDGTYPLQRPFNVVYTQSRYDENDLLRDFLTYLQSSDAQTIIEEEGYISLTSRTYSAYSVPETLPETTELSVGGSTSVQPLMSQLAYAYEELLGA